MGRRHRDLEIEFMSNAAANDSSWFGHPSQLARLFTTEMWERFGYYGMRALLMLYLTDHFVFNDKTSGNLYGAFTALVYLTPLFGGILADRYLGYKRSVKFGAVLMAIGYFMLCWGGEKAKPFLEFENQKYEVKLERSINSDGEKVLNRYTTVDGVQYLLKGTKTGTLAMESPQGNKELPKDTYKFAADRHPMWVNFMFLALTFVVVGNGFFKPNISTIVGTLYAPGDSRRDGGFTIFYMGINLGSMISQFLCPILQEQFGFWAGFLLAAIGMVCAWALFQFDGGRLKGFGETPAEGKGKSLPIMIGAFVAIPFIWYLLFNTMMTSEQESKTVVENVWQYFLSLPLLGKVMFAVFTSAIVAVPIWAFASGTREEAQKMFVAIVLVVFSVVFWTLFEQAGSSLTLYAKRSTDLRLFGWNMPAGQTQIFNPLFIVIFAPLMTMLWLAMARRKIEPSTPVKFAISLVLVGLGFLALVYGSRFADSNFKVGLFWLALAYLLHSIGELCLSPVGLSMITKLSMPRIVGLMMGVWFLCTSMAQYVAGIVSTMTASETVGGEVMNPELTLQTYVSVFQSIGIAGIIAGVLLFVMSPFLKKMMHGIN